MVQPVESVSHAQRLSVTKTEEAPEVRIVLAQDGIQCVPHFYHSYEFH